MKYVVLTILSVFLVSLLSGTSKEKKIKEKSDLGEVLFFDPILSSDSSISCASCHKPEFAFADNVAFSTGVGGKKTARNTPSAMNMSARDKFFWDGRAATLAEQALGPIQNPDEMNLPIESAIKRLKRSPFYSKMFSKFYADGITPQNLGDAIASYEELLETDNSLFDKFRNDEKVPFSESARRGNVIFNEKGKCFDCHFSPDFTADEFKNIGLYNGLNLNDPGRFGISKDSADMGKFKVPGLRNVAVTAPYMHNGMFKTLREVIDYYDNPDKFVNNSINRDTLLNKPLNLSEQEKVDLENFLNALTDSRFLKEK